MDNVKIAISILFLSFQMLKAKAQKDLRTKHFNVEKSIAIQGYDPVSYFSGKPKEGKSEFSYNFEGLVYRFISQVNLESFKANPTK